MDRKNFLYKSTLAGLGSSLIPSLANGTDTNEPEEIISRFPAFSKPIQITKDGKEHLYASYQGIDSFSRDEKYATVLETDLKYQLPTEDDPATLGLVDIDTQEFTPLAKTRAWNFQQGCMAHWLGTAPNSQIIFNDLRKGKFVSVIMDVHSKKELKVIPFPVAAVSLDGKKAIGLNFSRVRITRAAYGYGGAGQDARAGTRFPKDDGITLIDLETGKTELIVPIAAIKGKVPEVPQSGLEYFNHAKISPKGTKIFWLARATPHRNTTAFTVSMDGTNIQRCFPDGWGGSHFDWLTDDQLLCNAYFKGKQYSHTLFTIGEQDYKRLGNGLLDFDGHGGFSPDGRWMVTDDYPTSINEQKMYILDMKTQAAMCLGRFYSPEKFSRGVRCDLHNRWSRMGNLLGFNSVKTGSRQAYIMRLI